MCLNEYNPPVILLEKKKAEPSMTDQITFSILCIWIAQYRNTTPKVSSYILILYELTFGVVLQYCAIHIHKRIGLRLLSDQSCSAQLFFFSSNITGGLYSFKRIELRTLSDQSCSAQLFFFSRNNTEGYILETVIWSVMLGSAFFLF